MSIIERIQYGRAKSRVPFARDGGEFLITRIPCRLRAWISILYIYIYIYRAVARLSRESIARETINAPGIILLPLISLLFAPVY